MKKRIFRTSLKKSANVLIVTTDFDHKGNLNITARLRLKILCFCNSSVK